MNFNEFKDINARRSYYGNSFLLKAETSKAILVEELSSLGSNFKSAWLPKSQIVTLLLDNDLIAVAMPAWLAQSKDLDTIVKFEEEKRENIRTVVLTLEKQGKYQQALKLAQENEYSQGYDNEGSIEKYNDIQRLKLLVQPSQTEINNRAWQIAKKLAGGSKGSKKFLSQAMKLVWKEIKAIQ